MDERDGYYTISAYLKGGGSPLTAAMEDYLEMICRISLELPEVRIRDLARLLHVQPSSASKMAVHLRDAGYLSFERYGFLRVTDLGREAGAYLLKRHRILSAFFQRLNRSENELELVEKIEHFIDEETVLNLEKLTERLPE